MERVNENADIIKLGNLKISVIGREHLIAMWLLAGRAKDYQKIASFWEADILDKPKLIEILDQHNLSAKWTQEKWRFINEE